MASINTNKQDGKLNGTDKYPVTCAEPSLPKIHESPDLAVKFSESNRTPKLTPKNSQHLTQLRVAPELKNGKPSSFTSSPSSTPRVSKRDKEERPLLGGAQKIVIVPAGRSERPHVKVTVGSTSSSDSSDGKRTPPRKRAMSSGRKRPEALRVEKTPGVRMSPSLKSLKTPLEGKMRSNASWASFTFEGGAGLRPLSDVVSVRSLASIGMGSTDGKKLTIRRVPTSPTELLNLADPKT